MRTDRMTPQELRVSLSLSGIFGLRMLGLFIILPMFALYAEALPGGRDHTMVGIALGAYGLTQALLQIPFGWLSDRWGRKPTIYFGLAIFAVGSVVAAFAHTLPMIILGRVIQGAGAISAAVIALLADLTREEVRTKAMAIIGISIGLTFALSMIGGPILNRWIGVPGIFLLTGVLATGAMVAVRFGIPDPPPQTRADRAEAPRFRDVLRDPELARLNYGVFALNAMLMAMWVVVPFQLRAGGLEGAEHWKVYLPVMLGSILIMAPVLMQSERRGWQKSAFLGSVALLLIAQFLLAWAGDTVLMLVVALLAFFTAFNMLESSMPSMISKTAPPQAKGTAIGVYSSIQFLGTFVGAAVGGALSQHFGGVAVFGFCALLGVGWLAVAVGMAVPAVRTYPLPPLESAGTDRLLGQLRTLPGVRDATLAKGENRAMLRVDMTRFDEQNVTRLLQGET